MRKGSSTVSITIVTHNCEFFLERCLESVLAQDWPSLEVIAVDNDSQDGTRSILAKYREKLKVTFNSENRGFAAAQNQAIRSAVGEWILVMNPDVLLAPNFVSSLVRGGSLDPSIGTVCGKLLRATPTLEISSERKVDSAGIFFTPTFRHLDRGSNLPDGEEYNRPAFVFGATAAAALYRKLMIDAVSINGEFFDEDFFLYREDADVSWRAQLMGWRCLYFPDAVGHHIRKVLPGSRRTVPEAINRQSVQNRFLMRMKNVTLPLYLRNFLLVTAWDLGVFFYCVVAERTSLSAFVSVLRRWRRTLNKRRIIQQRRRVSDAYLQSWFRFRPVTFPIIIPAPIRTELASAPGARSTGPLPARARPERLRPL